ncbi:hypothetical protein IG193_08185 [Infirmifilum lucidum]|uniref:DUF86 domain-containing protein n=1 Tax=Infirmifilum lucidum TaxID=2776706 RepID=A0A7L9FIG2_9CREN|nr:hypothetical protein IG193_08185 [Infirmifilum lucidum]
MRRPIGFRNVLVHGYLRVNREYGIDVPTERKYREMLDIARSIVKHASDKGLDP